MNKLVISLIVATTMYLLPQMAQADVGYVCRVNQYNYAGFGADGGVLITFYTAPNCTGSYQYTGYACTAGATTDSCSSSSYYVYSEAQLQSLFTLLVAAGRDGIRIDYVRNATCQNGGTSCLQSINFYSN